MSNAPRQFLILSLPRSRSAWLSRFLTYGGWHCGHDEAVRWRSMEDARAWFSMDRTGSAETSIAPFWRLFPPHVRLVTVRRPVMEVVESCIRAGAPERARGRLETALRRHDRKLDQIERRVPGLLRVEYADLASETVCARLFKHCLGLPHDSRRWSRLDRENIQIDFPWMIRYMEAHREHVEKLSATARHVMLRDMALKDVGGSDNLTVQEETFETAYRDGVAMFERHCVLVGEHPRQFEMKNLDLMRSLEQLGRLQVVTARSNGRMFGYLVTVFGPSLEQVDRISATNTLFYAAEEMPGAGLRMQRLALALLKAKGVSEVILHAGIRGSGPRMGSLFRRLGATELGSVYRLDLEAA